MVKALIVAAALLLASCATTGTPPGDPRQIWCDHNSPRRHASAIIDAMPRTEMDEMNRHNALGERWCGWRP